jgi:hypothetical protein
MSSYNYEPIPPRVWSRVQNQCTYIVSGSTYKEAYIPLTGQTVSQAQADYETKMFYKGNILQYKANSAQFTKAQKYSQLAKMAGPNRTKVFATQSQTYTNPNTTGLLRVGYSTYPYPNEIVGAPNNVSGPFSYNIQNPNDCSGNSVQDGGTLVCGTYANPCTGEIIKQGPTTATVYNPASASNVPGSSILYWNNNIQTFFPRSRYFMNNSGNKWPQGYKGFVSAVSSTVPNAPVIVSYSSNNNDVFIEWTSSNLCSTVSGFNIYKNGKLVETVSYRINSTTINNLDNCETYNFYVTAFNSVGNSIPSNIVYLTIDYLAPPTITGITQTNTTAIINWISNANCSTITNYLLYENGVLIETLASSQTSITLSLTDCSTYTFYLISYDSNTDTYSSKSNIVSTSVVPNPPTLETITTVSFTEIELNWTPDVTSCTTITGWKIYDVTTSSTLIATISSSSITTYDISNLTPGQSYSYNITATYSGGESAVSNTESVTLPALYSYSGATFYENNGYTGLVFDYVSPTSQYVTFNSTFSVNILLVGGGGAGYQVVAAGSLSVPKSGGGVGGGGGGIYYDTNSLSGTFNISVGSPGAYDAGTDGGDTTFTASDPTLLTITAKGGATNNTSDQTSAALGGGWNIQGGSFVLSNGGNGGYGDPFYTPSPNYFPSTDSIIPTLNLPFTTSGTSGTTMYLSGGGGQAAVGGAVDFGTGGSAGYGTGGAFGGNTLNNPSGVSALNSSTYDCISVQNCGSGGGGSCGYGDPNVLGGNGGAGAVILWWTTV